MLGQRLRRRPITDPALGQRIVFAGVGREQFVHLLRNPCQSRIFSTNVFSIYNYMP